MWRVDVGCRLSATPVDIGRGTVGRLVVENRMSGDGQREVGGVDCGEVEGGGVDVERWDVERWDVEGGMWRGGMWDVG